jgi:hypothetical protein
VTAESLAPKKSSRFGKSIRYSIALHSQKQNKFCNMKLDHHKVLASLNKIPMPTLAEWKGTARSNPESTTSPSPRCLLMIGAPLAFKNTILINASESYPYY